MNLDELKIQWKSLNDRVMANQELAETIIVSITRQRSESSIQNIQNKLQKMSMFFLALTILFIAILTGNPFDYKSLFEYIPAIFYTILTGFGLSVISREIMMIRKISLTKSNLRESLEKIIHLQESFSKMMDRIWQISMGIAFLLSTTLIIRNLEKYGLVKIMSIITVLALTMYIIHLTVRMFIKKTPDKHLEDLKINLSELDS